MLITANYVSVALLGRIDPQRIGIETISIDSEGAALAGAWDYSISEKVLVENVIAGRYILALDEFSEEFLKPFPNAVFPLSEFIEEIMNSVTEIENEFNKYKMKEGSKKQKLVAPDLRVVRHPNSSNPLGAIEQLVDGKTHPGLDPKFSRIILGAWALRSLVEIWQHNESERVSRKYLEIASKPYQILPEKFLKL